MNTEATEVGRHLDHQALCLWLALVQLGGYWTVRQLRAEGLEHFETKSVRRSLDSLVNNGMARRRQLPANGAQALHVPHAAYGVTTLCAAQPGYEHALRGEPA